MQSKKGVAGFGRDVLQYSCEWICPGYGDYGGRLYGVSFAAALIAQRRGMTAQQIELLQMAGEILDELKITSPEENSLIQSAIYHHDDKAAVDS